MCYHTMQFCYVILLCNFVRISHKSSPLINTKLFIKIILCSFSKKLIYKEKCGTVKH